jgi:helix-turn-helix protein
VAGPRPRRAGGGTCWWVPYPPRPSRQPLEKFVGTAGTRQTPEQRAELLTFVAAGYRAGLSLRELAEMTSRTQTAIRRALDQAGVPRRDRGAPRMRGVVDLPPEPTTGPDWLGG